jgi:hypothetical protein
LMRSTPAATQAVTMTANDYRLLAADAANRRDRARLALRKPARTPPCNQSLHPPRPIRARIGSTVVILVVDPPVMGRSGRGADHWRRPAGRALREWSAAESELFSCHLASSGKNANKVRILLSWPGESSRLSSRRAFASSREELTLSPGLLG